MAGVRKEDVQRLIPDDGSSPTIPAHARITDALPPVNDNDLATKAHVASVATAAVSDEAVKGIFEATAETVEPISVETLTCQTNAIESVNQSLVSLGEYVNRLEAALAAQKIILSE